MTHALDIGSPSAVLVAEELVRAGELWLVAVFNFAALAAEHPSLCAELETGGDFWGAIERELLAAEARLGVQL